MFGAASAEAKSVTLGSSLPASMLPGVLEIDSSFTLVQSALPGATLTAPFDGTITSWKVRGASGGPFKLQVVRPLGGNLFTGAGTAVSGPITGPGVLTFKAKLPIEAGDSIGFSGAAGDKLGGLATPGSTIAGWNPALVDGAPGRSPFDPLGPAEIGFNATVESNCIVPKLKGKKLGAAKKALKKAGCKLGKVKKPKSKKAAKKAKYVKKQKPGAKSEVPGGTKVNLTMGPKKK
jgi:hypothetical protein